LTDIQDRDHVKLLIDEFYKKVVKDDVIKHFFTTIVKLDWDTHIPIMYDFWESILLESRNYKGNPMMKHIELSRKAPIEQIHFDRWIQLWEETIRSLFVGPKSEEAIERANSIASLMLHKIKTIEES
jgi:hemoglobin